jgi:hypothetical protein
MIEKVRSIAMISSLNKRSRICGAYIGDTGRRQAIRAIYRVATVGLTGRNYSNFTIMNPLCNSHLDCIQLGKPRLQSTERFPSQTSQRRHRTKDFHRWRVIRAFSLEETTMLRKLSLVAVAAASLGAAALAPTSASAFGYGYHGGWHRGFWGPRVFVGGPAYYGGYGYGGCYVRRLVPTPW